MNFSPFAEPDAKKDLTHGIEAINLMKTVLSNFYLFSDQKLLKRNQDYFGLILRVQRPLSEEKKSGFLIIFIIFFIINPLITSLAMATENCCSQK